MGHEIWCLQHDTSLGAETTKTSDSSFSSLSSVDTAILKAIVKLTVNNVGRHFIAECIQSHYLSESCEEVVFTCFSIL